LGEHRELGRELLSFGARPAFGEANWSVQRNAAPTVSALQARTYAEKASPTEVSSILEQRIRGVQEESNLAETGRVLSVGYVFQHNNKVLATDDRTGAETTGIEAVAGR
jgi:hypothetical protein